MSSHLISIDDLSPYEFNWIFETAERLKAKPEEFAHRLEGRIIALWMEHSSPLTSMSFTAGLLQMGGKGIPLDARGFASSTGENIGRLRQILDKWVSGIIVQTSTHEIITTLASTGTFPVINAESDRFRPCQALADFYTLKEKKGMFSGLTLAYIGVGGALCHSLIAASAKAGINLNLAVPEGFGPDPEVILAAERTASETGFSLNISRDPNEAVEGAHALYTTGWPLTGDKERDEERKARFSPFRVNRSILDRGRPDMLFMHDNPAFSDEEVVAEILGSPQSVAFEQGENRLHVQKAIMLLLELR